MTVRKDSTPTPGPAHQYKRSWKNLLINKKYQLRFTLFMVGLSSALMIGLGLWVMKVANETTQVSATSVRGTPCDRIPEIEAPEVRPAVPMKLDDNGEPPPTPMTAPPEPAEGSAASGSASGAPSGDEPPRRATIQMDESSMTIMPETKRGIVLPPDFGVKVVNHWQCELQISGKLDRLERGRTRILLVLIATGLFLVFGLAIYGIKMTHKVAGPLFKVGLYLGKMRNGRFDKVYNLRKGDQLVDFYEHFKHAHAGVVEMQKADIARIKAVVASAEAAGLGEHASTNELREMITRKEKSLE
ncbi:MAG: hypothetical protein H0T89_07870 [Deltaproteobacteria bacterium]|nr:hypothetical protein [Deltaproteobacteria bacterium]MDQ3300831.1 hypothetical protein [Myxococcota bacterium]